MSCHAMSCRVLSCCVVVLCCVVLCCVVFWVGLCCVVLCYVKVIFLNILQIKLKTCFAEHRCHPPPVPKNSHITSVNADIGNTSIIMCDKGYEFADGRDTSSFTCTEDLTWIGDPPACQGGWCVDRIMSARSRLATFYRR